MKFQELRGQSFFFTQPYLRPKASRFARPRLNCGMRAHAVVFQPLRSPLLRKWYATPAIIAPLSPQSLSGGKIQLRSVCSASIALKREFAATPPPATTVLRPVSSTARISLPTRVRHAVSWNEAARFSTLGSKPLFKNICD